MGIVQGLMMSYGGKKGFVPGVNTVAYYPLTTDANDYSGNARHGTPTNITYTGGYAIFNGSAYMIANTADIYGSQPFTLSAIINYTASPTTSIPLTFLEGVIDSGVLEKAIIINSGSSFSGYVFDGVQKQATTSAIYSTGNDYLVTTTFNGSTLIIYINGINKGSVASSGSYNYTTPKLGFSTGGSYASNIITRFTGKMKEVILENKARTSTEVSDYATMMGF